MEPFDSQGVVLPSHICEEGIVWDCDASCRKHKISQTHEKGLTVCPASKQALHVHSSLCHVHRRADRQSFARAGFGICQEVLASCFCSAKSVNHVDYVGISLHGDAWLANTQFAKHYSSHARAG